MTDAEAGRWQTTPLGAILDEPGEVHVHPCFGPAHVLTIDCWCHPDRPPCQPGLIVHHAAH